MSFPNAEDALILAKFVAVCREIAGISPNIADGERGAYARFLHVLGLSSIEGFNSAESNQRLTGRRAAWLEQKAALNVLLRQAADIGLDYCVVRGADCTERLYADVPIGPRGDIDLLIDFASLDRWSQMLCELGCVRLAGGHDYLLSGAHALRLELVTDLHGVPLNSRNLRFSAEHVGQGVRLSPSAAVWYTATYFHQKMTGQTSPTLLAAVDLVFWLTKFNIDWGYVRALARQSESVAQCSQVLRFLKEAGLTSISLPGWARVQVGEGRSGLDPIGDRIRSAWLESSSYQQT